MSRIKDISEADFGEVREVLLLGKGPTFSHGVDYRGSGHGILTCGVNQVVKKLPLDVLIASHIEPVIESMRNLPDAGIIIMPYEPIYGPQSKMLPIERWPEISSLPNLYCYNAHWQKERRGDGPQIQGQGCTFHALVNILARADFHQFTFAGVDGGKKGFGKTYYADDFDHDPKEYFERGMSPDDFDNYFKFYFQLRRKYGLSLKFL